MFVMKRLIRFHALRWPSALAVAAVLVGSIVLAPTVAAQKGVKGLFPAGTYRLSFADANFSGSTNNLELSFFDVATNTENARPDGAPQTTTAQTTIFMF